MNDKLIEPGSKFSFVVSEEHKNIRLDVFLSKQFKNYSRSYFQKLITEKNVYINGKVTDKSSYEVKISDEISITFPKIKEKDLKQIEENLGIEILFEHPDFLIVYKPAGVLVHEVGSKKDVITLVDWLLHKFKELSKVGPSERPGIVHRLDMLTSGIMIVPRNNFALMTFGNMFKNKEIKKTYLAIVQGHPEESGTIEFSILRHPSGHKMTYSKTFHKAARDAVTNFKVLKYLKDAALVEIQPETGRTHQIRVHFAAIGHPILGDTLYGKKSKLINHQALHACCLDFDYEGQKFHFEKEMPEDMKNVVDNLEISS